MTLLVTGTGQGPLQCAFKQLYNFLIIIIWELDSELFFVEGAVYNVAFMVDELVRV